MKKTLNNAGFAWVKTIIIVVIIGAIVGFAIPYFKNAASSQNVNQAITEAKTVADAISKYMDNNNNKAPATGSISNANNQVNKDLAQYIGPYATNYADLTSVTDSKNFVYDATNGYTVTCKDGKYTAVAPAASSSAS